MQVRSRSRSPRSRSPIERRPVQKSRGPGKWKGKAGKGTSDKGKGPAGESKGRAPPGPSGSLSTGSQTDFPVLLRTVGTQVNIPAAEEEMELEEEVPVPQQDKGPTLAKALECLDAVGQFLRHLVEENARLKQALQDEDM